MFILSQASAAHQDAPALLRGVDRNWAQVQKHRCDELPLQAAVASAEIPLLDGQISICKDHDPLGAGTIIGTTGHLLEVFFINHIKISFHDPDFREPCGQVGDYRLGIIPIWVFQQDPIGDYPVPHPHETLLVVPPHQMTIVSQILVAGAPMHDWAAEISCKTAIGCQGTQSVRPAPVGQQDLAIAFNTMCFPTQVLG